MSAIILDDHRGLFRSDTDFEQFVALFEGSGGRAEMTSVWGRQKHLATLVPPATPNTFVKDRIFKAILERPSMLDEVRDRLVNDEIVD